MPRAPVTALLSLSRRRGYAAAAAAAGAEVQQRVPAAMTARISGADGGSNGAASSEEIFWMRHPETGCWVPQDRFADVDAAELRARLLSSKN